MKLITIAIAALGVAAFGAAQVSGPAGGGLTPTKPAHHGQHPMIAELAKLNLSPKQKTEIAGMLKQRRSDNKAFRKSNQGNLPALKAHAKQEKQAFLTSLKSVLTPAQWQQFQSDMKALKGEGSRKGGSTPPAVRP